MFNKPRRARLTWLLIVAVAAAACACSSEPDAPETPAPQTAQSPAEPVVVAPIPYGAGVTFQQVSFPQDNGWWKLWIYRPDPMPAVPVPCIFVAPAGSPMWYGMGLGEADQPEHMPYVHAGFIVVAYELTGGAPVGASDVQLIEAFKKFRDADGGVADAQRAIDYIAANELGADPQAFYLAGHSSAATVALYIASREPRVAGCIAYAPAPSITRFHGEENVRAIEPAAPGFGAFARNVSPETQAASIQCPVFLFHARDDSIVSFNEGRQFAVLLRQTNSDVTFVPVSSGDHYDSMINEGIPRAIDWIRQRNGG